MDRGYRSAAQARSSRLRLSAQGKARLAHRRPRDGTLLQHQRSTVVEHHHAGRCRHPVLHSSQVAPGCPCARAHDDRHWATPGRRAGSPRPARLQHRQRSGAKKPRAVLSAPFMRAVRRGRREACPAPPRGPGPAPRGPAHRPLPAGAAETIQRPGLRAIRFKSFFFNAAISHVSLNVLKEASSPACRTRPQRTASLADRSRR